MPAKFEIASKEVHALCKDIISEHHDDLRKNAVKIDILMAFGAEDEQGNKQPALKHGGGYEALGLAMVTALKHRVLGLGDALIILDGDNWDKLNETQQRSLLDHELTHYRVGKNAENATLRDTHGRPKLKMRLHDRQIGWFDCIAERYGEEGLEVQHAKQLYERGQCYFPFLNEEAKVELEAALS